MHRLKQLIREIHRRSLWQVLAIYVAASWAVFEAVQTLTEGVGLPGWLPSLALVLLLVGLPIVLATAFVQERGPTVRGADPTLVPRRAEPSAHGSTGAGGMSQAIRRLFTWRNAILGGLLAFALWGIAAAGWLILERSRAGRAAADGESRASIAVLPFVNMSADTANEYFSDGITEEIIAALSGLEGLQVISRSATFRYKGTAVNPRDVGRELGVATILEGSVRREAERVRITAQLIDVADGFHLWSESYERRLAGIFQIQQDVARNIAEALRLTLSEGDREAIERRATDDLAAYELYSRGRHEFYKYTPEGHAAAIELFQRALERDPDYALALAGLSLCQWQYFAIGWSEDEDWLRQAEAAARRALQIDPELAEAHFALGVVYGSRGLSDAHEVEMKRVLELNPNHAHAHDAMGDAYFRRGLLDEALNKYAIALRLDPFLVPSHYFRGLVPYLKGQFREALRAFAEGRELLPEVDQLHLGFGTALMEQGRFPEAIQSYERAIALAPQRPDGYVGLARAQLAAGDLLAVRSTAERLLAVSPASDRIEAAWNYIQGTLALRDGAADSALALFNLAESSDPLAAIGWNSLLGSWLYARAVARAHLARGDAPAAAKQLEAMLRAVPAWKSLRYERARALEAAGDLSEARMEYERFLESWRDADPDASILVDARRRYATLTATR